MAGRVNESRVVSLLGATGSVGRSTLDVIERHPERFSLAAVTARSSVGELAAICARHRPRLAAIADPAREAELTEALRHQSPDTRVMSGEAGLAEAATLDGVDTVMAAIVGAAGLAPTLAAVRAGRRVLLANKEALVMAGDVFMDAVRRSGAFLMPIDSEHNAVFQCLGAGGGAGVARIVLTASGGPFLRRDLDDLDAVTPDEACAHPIWDMGRKISVDSATLMNKGLELIEAHWLFGVASERLDVVIHPQSIVHSLVHYTDGSVLAQLGNPDMRVPVAHALAHPERVESGVRPLDLAALGSLEFESPDLQRFPCLRLAREALESERTAPAVLNAANEEAVAAFLAGRLRFPEIPAVIGEVLERCETWDASDLDAVMAADAAGRRLATERIGARGRG